MPLSTATITFDISDQLGTDYDRRRGIRGWIDTNIPNDTVVDVDGNKIRLGSGKVTFNDDGTGSFTVWTPGTGSNPASWQTYFHVEYVDSGNHAKGRATRTFGPFTITANADLADLIEEQEVPPDFDSVGFLAQAEALRDEQLAIAAGDISATISAEVGDALADAPFTSRYAILGSGTSQRVGVGTTDPATKNYGTRAAARLGADLAVTVGDTNAGASGANSTQLLSYLPGWLADRRPHVVTIELPINDVNLSNAVARATTIANLGKQIGLVRLAGGTPVLVITPAINPWAYGNVGQQTDATQLAYSTLRADALTLAASLRVPVADGHLAMRAMVNILADGVHMNDTGADALGRVVAETIEGAPPADVSTTIFSDTFSSTLSASWVPTLGSWTVESGKARSATGGDGEIALRETSRADHAIFADLSWASGSIDGGIVARGASGGTGYLATLYPNGANTDLRLYYLSGGGATLLTQEASVSVNAAGANLGITVGGNNILVWLDGIPRLSCASTLATGTKVGLRQQANTALRFDNVRASY